MSKNYQKFIVDLGLTVAFFLVFVAENFKLREF